MMGRSFQWLVELASRPSLTRMRRTEVVEGRLSRERRRLKSCEAAQDADDARDKRRAGQRAGRKRGKSKKKGREAAVVRQLCQLVAGKIGNSTITSLLAR